ncbi:MAG: DUF1294 domain-containing protein [Variovorax sp.]|nr:MAG: DUF1294 domain-containing protein [Variovorax sp.]
MKRAGTVRKWDAARGFGFIRGPGDGADVFFHLRDWRGSAPPREGMSVGYEEIHVGGKGPRAMAVLPDGVAITQRRLASSGTAAARAESVAGAQARRTPDGANRSRAIHRQQPRPAPRAAGASWWWPAFALWLGALAAGVAWQRLPLWGLGALVAVNVVTLLVYALDKSAAARGGWRTREDTLHLLSLAGGWPAARLAQQSLRHKSSKLSFQRVYALTVVLHGAALGGWVFWLAPEIAR